MERQLDATGGAYLTRKMENLGVRVLLRQADAGAARQRSRGRAAVRDGEETGSRTGGDRGGHPAQRGTRPQGRTRSATAASSSTTTWRHRDPDIFAVGECTEHRGQTVRPGGAAVRTGQGAGRDHHRQSRTGVHGRGARRQAQDHGRRRLLGRQHRRDRAGRRDRALRRSRARHLQEAAASRTTGCTA